MNVLVSLTATQVRSLEKARHILARKEAMGERYGTVVDDLSDILGMARAERLHSVRAPLREGLLHQMRVPAADIDGLEPDDPRSTGWYERKAAMWDMRDKEAGR